MDSPPWEHNHSFGCEIPVSGERRTRWVIALTVVMMIVEIIAGFIFGSMALLADGWHMATHVLALSIAAFAYAYARRHAHDQQFSFGTGKVSALGGFGSAVTLGIIAILVLFESVERLFSPVTIRFDEAIIVAVIGLVVNLASAVLLHDHDAHAHEHHHDHNLRGAYMHVLADALTSVFAIAALLAGKFFGWFWIDAAVGILGSVVITRWAVRLLRDTSAVLLDSEVPDCRRDIQATLEADGHARVTDLHLWRVGRHHFAAIVTLVSDQPQRPDHYKQLLTRFDDLAHVTVEVHMGPPGYESNAYGLKSSTSPESPSGV